MSTPILPVAPSPPHQFPGWSAGLAAVVALAGWLPSIACAETPTFQRYQQLLDDFLVVTSAPGEPLETRFHYVPLYDSKGRYERMARIRRELISVTPSRMKPSERLAWAINTYNFLVIDLVITHLVDANISKYRMNEGYTGVLRSTVQQIRIEGQSFFEAPVVEIEDRVFSLNAFERTFVFEGYTLKAGTPPPPALDPRAHFALVCAARGCPPLQPRAFHPDSLDLELERATRQALQQSAHLRLDPETGVLFGSSVFNWYAADFGGEEGAYAFAERHAPESLRRLLAARPKRRFDQFITWDWKLNDAPRPATGPPSSARDSN